MPADAQNKRFAVERFFCIRQKQWFFGKGDFRQWIEPIPTIKGGTTIC